MRRVTINSQGSVRQTSSTGGSVGTPAPTGRHSPRILTDEQGEEHSQRSVAESQHTSDGFVGAGADGLGEIPRMEPDVICMTVVEDGPNIACACYNEERNEIILEHCHAGDYKQEEILERFIAATRPNLILVGNKILNNESMMKVVTRRPSALTANNAEDGSGIGSREGTTNAGEATAGRQELGAQQNSATSMALNQSTIPYRLLKSGAFDIRACRSLILQALRVLSLFSRRPPAARFDSSGIRRFASQGNIALRSPSTYHALAALVNFDAKVEVQALGSLLSHLQATIFRFEEGGTITVNNIIHAESTKYLYLSESTFAALHIFSTEHHPLLGVRGKGQSKEGFSLYSVLDRTISKGGKKVLRDWMLKPLVDLEKIITRQDAVEYFMRPDLETSIGILANLLGQIGPIDNIIRRMHKCLSKPIDILTLTRTITAAISIHSTLENHVLPSVEPQPQDGHEAEEDGGVGHEGKHTRPSLLYRIFDRCNVEALLDLEERITDAVDVEATRAKKHSIVIRDGFDEELDSWKEKYETIEDTLEGAGAEIYERHPELQNLSVVYFPQVGFLIALSFHMVFNAENELIIQLPEDFSHQFSQDEDAFFKNNDMRELDDSIGDVDRHIKDIEGVIVANLEEDILDTETELRETFNALSELDCLLSLAGCAADLNFVRPQIVNSDDQRICIKDGRHPLQEIVTETEFVPNDTEINHAERLNIVTGPNFSGKSCYARHVGVLVYMAHIGSFLPCTTAIISLTDHIFAQFESVETCAVPQSSFQFNLTQMATILRRSTRHSLVLIDEFGKGTSPSSGIALLTAALKKLSEIGCKVVCTTHFLEIFRLNLLEDGKDGIKAKQMMVRLPDTEPDGAVPLFKLTDGVASSSAGLICAVAAGMNPIIVNRAKEINLALREGRQVKPFEQALPPASVVDSAEKEVLTKLFSVENWETANNDQLRELLQAVARL